MKTKLSDITVLLDRSGSMNSIANETIRGFNSFLNRQRKLGGDAVISLVQFSDKIENTFTSIHLKAAEPLSKAQYEPTGRTALLDAIGLVVLNTAKRAKARRTLSNPIQIIICVLTDGHENASRRFTRERIFKLISEKTEKENWQFVFLGANQNAIQEGASLGISRESSLTYAHSREGTLKAFNSISRAVENTRTSAEKRISFSDADREAQENLSRERRKQRPSKN